MRAISCAAAALLLAVATRGESTLRATVQDAKGERVPDAVVSLYASGGALAAAAADGPPVEIVQHDQEYIPYVTVIREGTRVEFPNKDTIQHHIYSLSKAKRFEKPLYAPGARESVVFDQPGIVTLGCNIHDWMIAYIVVLPTPYFAKTGNDGVATLAVPPGKYRVEVWHPRLAKPSVTEVTLADTLGALDFELTLKPDRRIRRTTEKKAGGY